ncbi:MAG: molybdopterin-dependent oxidoreductase [Chlorobiales bacterium]|nr:molybdopterin-dependent oxidoreductase [Chlorobiales bacterium]
MKKTALLGLIFCLIFTPFSFGQTKQKKGSKAQGQTSEQVVVKGRVQTPFTITLTSVKNLPVKEDGNKPIVCQSGQTRKTLKNFKGVLLRDIIDSAKVKMDKPHDRGEFFVRIGSTDNYNVLFTYNELYFGLAGDSTYLVFEENDQPITDEGYFVVFCADDKITGPRHVKWVNTIEVGKINTSHE